MEIALTFFGMAAGIYYSIQCIVLIGAFIAGVLKG